MTVELAILWRCHPRELDGLSDRDWATIFDVLEEMQR